MIIDHTTPNDLLFPQGYGRGCVPRDYSVQPLEMFSPPSEMQLIPRSEWDARIDEQEKQKSSLQHLRNRMVNGQRMPSLDQGQVGYCWAHSTVHAVMLSRVANNQPYVPLSAYAVAATIKKGKDEGGWNGLSAQFATEKGIPSQALWPQGSRDYRKYDTPEVWADAAKHKITENWTDLSRSVYDRNLTFDQLATQLLLNNPCPVDFNWWGHSVCAMRLVRVEKGSYGIAILNSWSDSWGEDGVGILRGDKANPDGALAIRHTTAS